MFDLSGLAVAISSIGVAWVTAYYGFRNTQEASRREHFLEIERYRSEQRKEQDRLLTEPLRMQKSELESFIRVLSRYYRVANSNLFSEEEKKASEIELIGASGIVYQYVNLRTAFERFYPYGSDIFENFDGVMNEAQLATEGIRRDLARNHEEIQSRLQSEIAANLPIHDQSDGLVVEVARWIQAQLRRLRL